MKQYEKQIMLQLDRAVGEECANYYGVCGILGSECLYSVYLVREQLTCSWLDIVTYLAKLLLPLEIGKCEIAESNESWSCIRRVLGVK
jgi:hypothetical protein